VYVHARPVQIPKWQPWARRAKAELERMQEAVA